MKGYTAYITGIALLFIVAANTAPTILWTSVGEIPHDTTAFTQGLLYVLSEQIFYESTGLTGGRSQIRRLRGDDASVVLDFRSVEVVTGNDYFAEGLDLFEGRLLQLTWQDQIGLIWDTQFNLTGSWSYTHEGWGITNDGSVLIISDGTSLIRFVNATTFAEIRTITVREDGAEVMRLNELEYIYGYIFANVWLTNIIVIIDPDDGTVIGRLDLTPLTNAARILNPSQDVLNGIAYNSATDIVYITGKFWARLYSIQLVDFPPSTPTTLSPTTLVPVTTPPITSPPTTLVPVTLPPVTASPTTESPMTAPPTTLAPATAPPTTLVPVTTPPVTASPTTESPMTAPPTTEAPTPVPTTLIPTTETPTQAPTTSPPSTEAPSDVITQAPTLEPTSDPPLNECVITGCVEGIITYNSTTNTDVCRCNASTDRTCRCYWLVSQTQSCSPPTRNYKCECGTSYCAVILFGHEGSVTLQANAQNSPSASMFFTGGANVSCDDAETCVCNDWQPPYLGTCRYQEGNNLHRCIPSEVCEAI